MRIALAVVVLALSTAPVAAASFGPPLVGVPSTLQTLPLLSSKAGGERASSSCSVHAVKSRGTAGRIERKLAPVACEQPPRSHALGTGFLILLAP